MKRNNKKGFTIVELVIVIAVIAILAGVMIPTFGGIINKANQSKALQEAKNAYTNALIEDYDAEYDYVCDGTYHFDVDNDFAVTNHATHAQGDSVLDTTNP